MTGAYIVIEGIDEAAKKRLVSGIAERLAELDTTVEVLDGSHRSGTAKAITQLIRGKRRSWAQDSKLLLKGARAIENAKVLKPGMQQGTVYVTDRGQLQFLVDSFYDGVVDDYHAVNSMVTFMNRQNPPTITLVLDSASVKQPSDDTKAALLEKRRAGYLWEAKQRGLPIVYETSNWSATLDQAWRAVAAALHLEKEAIQQPTAIAEVLATSPAAKVIAESKQLPTTGTGLDRYFVPPALPDNLQCDYCDEVDRMLSAHKKLVRQLAGYLHAQETPDLVAATKRAEQILQSAKPLATIGQTFIAGLSPTSDKPSADLSAHAANHYDNPTDSLILTSYHPRNEFDLVPQMLAGPGKKPSGKLNFDRWTYEAKHKALQEYMSLAGKKTALSAAQYTWLGFTASSVLIDLQSRHKSIMRYLHIEQLTPRYGYETPSLVEEAGLSDAYDELYDLSLQAHSRFSAQGRLHEAQYLTLAGHKQPWQLTIPGDVQLSMLQRLDTWIQQEMRRQIAERHPMLIEYGSKKVDRSTTRA